MTANLLDLKHALRWRGAGFTPDESRHTAPSAPGPPARPDLAQPSPPSFGSDRQHGFPHVTMGPPRPDRDAVWTEGFGTGVGGA
jgi:hypothetical protein